MEGTLESLEPPHLQHEPEIMDDKPVTPLPDKFTMNNLCVDDHFLKPYYYLKEGEPYMLKFLCHRICQISLAYEHSFFKTGMKYIIFKSYKIKFGTILSPETTLAVLTDNTGKAHEIPACLHGRLIDINTKWIKNAKRLKNPEVFFEYIAIIESSVEPSEVVKANFLAIEDYRKMLRNKCEGKLA